MSIKLKKYKFPKDEHAKLSPSGSKRWLECAGSFLMTSDLPHDTAGYAAQWGTVAHHIADQCLRKDIAPETFLGQTIDKIEVDKEMVQVIQEYLDAITHILMENPGATMFSEVRVMADDSTPFFVYGTVDCLIITKDTIYVIDLKTGKGISVDADSSQLIIYAIGTLNMLPKKIKKKIKHVQCIIVQPRDKRGEYYKVHKITPKDLKRYHKNILLPGICDATKPDASLVPGEAQCQWCKAATFCSALADYSLQVAVRDFNVMTDEELAEAYHKFKLIKSWMTKVTDYLKEQLNDGVQIKGVKLVAGRSSRQWNEDDKKMTKLLKALGLKTQDIYIPSTLISLPQTMKLLTSEDKKKMQEYVTKVEGNPMMVKESDSRQAIKTDPSADFDD